jgi:hypothetical protein
MTKTIEAWDYFELELTARTPGNPFLDVTLAADFAHNDRTIRVSGFYDGDDAYKVRFMPDMQGSWRFVTHSNVSALDNQSGSFECVAPSGHNHGPVRVVDQVHFAYADGTPYRPVGTTCYVWNLQGDVLEERTLDTLSEAPFNKLRMCVFPKRYTYNFNEPPCYPFAGELKHGWDPVKLHALQASPPDGFWDFDRFNPEYFRRLEQRILDLAALGIEADLILFHPYDVGAWGFDKMPAEVNDRYLKYLCARIAAFRNVWWSFANEYDLMFHLTMADWDHFFQLVEDEDPYDHLRSIHNCRGFYDHGKPWVTHCSIQHQDLSLVGNWLHQYGKPVVVDECGYEGDIHMSWGDLSPEEMVRRFWTGFVLGGYVGHGETYVNDREELWWSKGGELVGQSPARIAFLREIFEAAPALCPVAQPEGDITNLLEDIGVPGFKRGARVIDRIIPEGLWNSGAAGYHEDDYFIFYFGNHQPGSRYFNLPQDSTYRVDVIDTWNMTVDCFSSAASGAIKVPMPAREYMAVRIEKN